MLLREMFEDKGQSVGLIFGRFNPPHRGHRAAWELASENEHWFVGTNESTQGPKDPLPFKIKVEAMKTIWPDVDGHIVADTSWLTLASKIYKKFGDVTLNVYTDEDWVTKTIQQYNGKEGPHGVYKFSNINQVPTPRLSSATALRAAVQSGDREAFSRAAGVPADTEVAGQPFFDLVAEYLLPYAEKEKAKAEKKKKKEPVAEAPIEMDPADPMDPMIYGHEKANPGKLKYRMMRAERQLSDLADRAKNASPAEWQIISKQFSELSMNINQIKHGLEELGKVRRKGGVRSRGIDPMIDSVAEGFFSIDDSIKGKIQNIVSDLSDIPGMWDHREQTFTSNGLEKLKARLKKPKYIKYALSLTADDFDESIEMERVRDPEDWDEGNTEPPNNFAVYINGKKWKVFKGKGRFADDYKERAHFRQLQNWAQAKSQATGKEWKVFVTGESPT